MAPFDIARSTIVDAKDINIHSRIDVLAYRSVALAHLGRCEDAVEDLSEIDRLIAIFNDGARTNHWKNQRQEIRVRDTIPIPTTLSPGAFFPPGSGLPV